MAARLAWILWWIPPGEVGCCSGPIGGQSAQLCTCFALESQALLLAGGTAPAAVPGLAAAAGWGAAQHGSSMEGDSILGSGGHTPPGGPVSASLATLRAPVLHAPGFGRIRAPHHPTTPQHRLVPICGLLPHVAWLQGGLSASASAPVAEGGGTPMWASSGGGGAEGGADAAAGQPQLVRPPSRRRRPWGVRAVRGLAWEQLGVR